MPMTFSGLVQRRYPQDGGYPPAGPSRAPAGPAGPSAGLFSGLDTFRAQNPGVLGSFGAAIMAGGNSRMAEGMQQAAKLQALNGQRQQMAQYLVSQGIADDMGEAMMLASNPTLLQMMVKDNSTRDAFEQRRALAGEVGLTPDNADYQRYLLTGQIADQSASGRSPLTMSPQEREVLADQYGLQGATRQRFILTGQIDSSAARGLSSTQFKEKVKAEDALPALQTADQALARAEELLPSINTGFGSDTGARIVTGLDQWGLPTLGADPATAAKTQEFNDLMNQQAIEAMAQTLTGATTNFELQEFKRILADPNAPKDQKLRTIQRMRQLLRQKAATFQTRINELEGIESGDAGMFGGTPAPDGSGVVDFNDWMGQNP